MAREARLLSDVRTRAIVWPTVRLFRNNVGQLTDLRGNQVRFGLAPGSSDLIGWREVTITPAMVGRTIAQFVAIETKAKSNKVTDVQAAFLGTVKYMGGHAKVIYSVDEAERFIYEAF